MKDDIIAEAVSAIVLLAISFYLPFVFRLAFSLFHTGADALVGWLRSHMSAKEFGELEMIARVSVGFVEEASRLPSVQKASQLKYAEAEAAVDAYLKRRNLKFSAAEVQAAILDALHSARSEWEIQEATAATEKARALLEYERLGPASPPAEDGSAPAAPAGVAPPELTVPPLPTPRGRTDLGAGV